MQYLRDWLGPRADGVSLQTISDSLRAQFSGAGGTDDGPRHRQGKVTGDHRHQFTLHFEPRSEGSGLCQTGVLVANAAATSGGQPIAVSCRWTRHIGSHVVDIPGTDWPKTSNDGSTPSVYYDYQLTGNMYNASADDIGMDIVCEADPTEGARIDGHCGRARGILGPFELNPVTRLSLENRISSGGTTFLVQHFQNEDFSDPHPRDLQIHVMQDYVKVVHPSGQTGGREIVANYVADYPRAVLHPLDTSKFRLELSEAPEHVYLFGALSRTNRDLIALMIRCFHARRYVSTSLILGALFQNPATPGAPPTSAMRVCDFDVRRLMQRLCRELDRAVGQVESAERLKRIADDEKKQLEDQLDETIRSYTETFERLDQRLAQSAANGPPLQGMLHEAESNGRRLQLQLQEVMQKMEKESRTTPAAAESPEGQAAAAAVQAQAIRAENAQLVVQIKALTGNAAISTQRDHTRSSELKRLRQDVDKLHGEKQSLERGVEQAEREKGDLIENFLYVKGRFDEMQMGSVQTSVVSPEIERELSQLRERHSQAFDERNKFAMRAEALDRDREKQKAHRESALDRVMAANARLLEERDRLERERVRVAELYQRTVSALGAGGALTEQTCTGSPNSSSGGCGASLVTLRVELAQKTEQLTRRDQEGESLRTRLRKLAMQG